MSFSSARRALVLLALGTILGGCAGVADVTGTATQQDLTEVRTDITALQIALQRSKTDNQGLATQVESRLREQAAEDERQRADLTKRLDQMSQSLAAITSRLDELQTRVDTLSKRIARAPAPRPPAPPAPAPGPAPKPLAPTPAPAPSPAPPGTPPPATPPAQAPPPPAGRAATSLGPQDVYQAAYLDFSKGNYTLAIAGFREFLRRYPDHQLADNAQYWIGEAYTSLAHDYANSNQADRSTQSLEQAVQEFRKVVANYPRGDKTPTALYKEALALIELKQTALAQNRLQYLIDNFPQAVEVPLARERLASLKEHS